MLDKLLEEQFCTERDPGIDLLTTYQPLDVSRL